MKSKEVLEQIKKENSSIDVAIIEKDLNDLEWLKTKMNFAFLDSLTFPEDKIRVLSILGINYTE